VAQAGFETSGFDPALGRCILFEQVQGQAAQNGEVLGRRADSDPALILAKGHIEQPMDLILDAPMAADRLAERLG